MAYIGRQNLGGAYRQLDDISSGFDGSDTTHTMQVNSQNVTVGDVNQIILSLGGVIQNPGTDFTVSGSVLTFTTAPAANTSFFAILLGSDNGGTVTPTDGSVTGDKLASNIAITTSGDISFDGGSFVFNESSADKDFRVESNGNTHMLFVDGGNDKVGIGESANAPMGTLHVKTADSGDTAIDSNNDDLVIENDNHAGITISTPNDKAGGLYFSDPDDAAAGRIVHDHNANTMTFQAGNLEFLRTDSSRKLSTGGEDAADCDAGGLTLDQNANDASILTFKSSDVSHGFTGQVEADTYGRLQKHSASAGGLQILGLAEDDPGLILFGVADTTSGTVAANTHACVHIDARKTTGGSVGTIGSDMLCLFQNDGSAKVIITGAGNIHSDASATVGTYDEYEDAHLVRAYDLSHGKGVIDSKFDKFISYNAEKLADLELIGRDDDGTPNSFVNVTGFQKLHNGAIWQQYEKHQRLAEAVYEMAKEALGEDKADAILEKHDIKLLN